uniref:eL27 n=1 Tax=Paranosema locustae TaxID=235221 RepID=UPI00187D6DB9|nr:Chain LZ0, eL27 [Paranosema locustae]
MLLKPNTVVVALKGRFAGKKGVVVSASEDGRKILVAGIEKMPQPVTDDMSECKKKRLSRMSAFIKNYNSRHLLATRYYGDVGLGAIDFSRIFENFESKKMAIDAVKKAFINANKQKKAAWLFEKLVF